MPEQVKRLIVIVIIIIAVFIVARKIFVPDTFYELGHYRAAAIDSIAAQPIVYAGHAVCFDCHNEIEDSKKNSYHRTVNCEACHGPGVDHISSFEEDEIILPPVERKRESCPICHQYNQAKPTGFPQIDKVTHNPLKPCISCHDPHVPDPPETPGECRACHARIANTKALSPHSLLECIQCHKTPEEHKSNPRGWLPGKPEGRSDCGLCHSQSSESDVSIPRIDLQSHGDGFLCWQCHYPHYPEAK